MWRCAIPSRGTLPQERENRFAVVGEFGRAQFAKRSEAKSKKAELAREANEFFERVARCSLSPGESTSAGYCTTAYLHSIYA